MPNAPVPPGLLPAEKPPHPFRAELLDKQLAEAVAGRERLADRQIEAQQMRQRAFSLFVHTYDQVRRAITYLLWDDPARLEAVCPSLYTGQRGKRGTRVNETLDADDSSPPAPADASTGTSKDSDASPPATGVHELP
ncbi:MAG: hypothetical protein EOO72_00745 [Myxococcaceae bacterium]|nr:MAG: hypothetical protein EOO72_00745 [Myxococcaceae bacterium]